MCMNAIFEAGCQAEGLGYPEIADSSAACLRLICRWHGVWEISFIEDLKTHYYADVMLCCAVTMLLLSACYALLVVGCDYVRCLPQATGKYSYVKVSTLSRLIPVPKLSYLWAKHTPVCALTACWPLNLPNAHRTVAVFQLNLKGGGEEDC